MTEINILGEPLAGFKRSDWQIAVENEAMKIKPFSKINGVNINFSLSTFERNGQRFDLDNLCHCIFSALRFAGWFETKPKIKWWHSTRRIDKPSGVSIIGKGGSKRPVKNSVWFHGIYEGKLPMNSSDENYIAWVIGLIQEHKIQMNFIPNNLGVEIRFGSNKENIGEIATGRVKNIIDCLYPLIGGHPRYPDDWKIHEIFVEKDVYDLARDEVEVTVWSLESIT